MLHVSLDFVEWLILTGRGVPGNVSGSVALSTTSKVNVPNIADVGASLAGYVLVYEVQFDGILSGLVGYTLQGSSGETAGFAVQGTPTRDLCLSTPGKPVVLTIQNGMTDQVLVYNADYVIIDPDVYKREIAAVLESAVRGPH